MPYRWLENSSDSTEGAFQCSDDLFDLKLRGNQVICGLRNGTVEVWHLNPLRRELKLDDQSGSVQESSSNVTSYIR